MVAYLLETEDRVGSDSGGTTIAAAMSSHTTRLIDIPNKRGSTPLLFAIYGAHAPAPLVERLLARGADPGQTDHDGVGVLHVCASQGHQHLLPLFLGRFQAQGLNVAALVARQDANGHDPVFYARMKGHTGIVRMLEEAAGPGKEGGGKA